MITKLKERSEIGGWGGVNLEKEVGHWVMKMWD